MTRTRFAAPAALTTLLAALLAATVLPGQTVREGYETTLTNLPSTAGQPLVLGSSVVYFTGTQLVLAGGGANRTLLTLPNQVFGSFVIPVGGDRLLFGENSGGGVWIVPLTGGGARQLATVLFNYAATPYDADWAIVSAKTGGLSAKDNDLIAINLNTGALDPIALIPGASGPLVCDRHGNLFYATGSASFPPPRGFVEILRFAAGTVAGAFGPGRLGRADAALIHKGLDAAGALVLDDDHDLLVTDWMNNEVVEVSDVHTAFPKVSTFATYSLANVSPGGLQFVPGERRGLGLQEFEAFQPAGGGSLIIHESAFRSISQLRRVAARRPGTEVLPPSPVPPSSAFSIRITGGPAGGTGTLALGLGAPRREVVAIVPGLEPVLFWADSLLGPFLTPLAFDANGEARAAFQNPGFPVPVDLSAQCFLMGKTGDPGTSEPLRLTLR